MSEAVAGQEAWQFEPMSCPLCGPVGERVLGSRGGRAHRAGLGVESRIVQCVSCGLIFANPMPHPTQAFANYHDTEEYFRNHDPKIKIAEYVERYRYAERLLGRRGVTLDVGCGSGESLLAAQQAGWDAVGIEPSAEFAEFARQRYGADVRVGELADVRFDDGSFDFLTLGAVLEHVFEPLVLLREMRRVLRPGGLAYIGVPNEAGLYWTLGNAYQRLRGRDWVLNISPTFEPFHTLGWSKRSLRKALVLAGLEPMKMWTTANEEFYGLTSASSTPYERAAELVDRVGGLVDAGSQLDAWARAL